MAKYEMTWDIVQLPEILQQNPYFLGVLSLSGTGLSGNEHGLILLVHDHVSVCLIGGGEQVRRHLVTSLAHVVLDDGLGVDGQTLVGVDDDAEKTGVGLKIGNKLLDRYHLVEHDKTTK